MKSKVFIVALYVASVVAIVLNVYFVRQINEGRETVEEIEQNISETRAQLQETFDGIEKTRLTKMYFTDVFTEKSEKRLDTIGNDKLCAFVAVDGDKFGTKSRAGMDVGKLISKFADVFRKHFGNEDENLLCNVSDESDEMYFLLTNRDSVEQIKEELDAVQEDIRAVEFVDNGVKVSGTLSMGVVVFRPGNADFRLLFLQADELLYEAKNAGRDRYVLKVIGE